MHFIIKFNRKEGREEVGREREGGENEGEGGERGSEGEKRRERERGGESEREGERKDGSRNAQVATLADEKAQGRWLNAPRLPAPAPPGPAADCCSHSPKK